MLTSYRGVDFSYDAIGNPLVYYNGSPYIFTWEHGRQLSTVMRGGYDLSFEYNNGIRTSKTVDGVEHVYHLNGSQIIAEEWAGNLLVYIYDAEGTPIGMQHKKPSYPDGAFDSYWFEKNLQGDVVAVYDDIGDKLIAYTYDAWGNFTTTYYSSSASVIDGYNPFRYRGYHYDTETGFYYLNSRYYDPVVGRFISPDSVIADVGSSLQGYNLYAYCFNNPVNMFDQSGNWPKWVETVAKVVSVAVVVSAVVVTVGAVSAFTAGTGTPGAVYGATIFLGAALSGINGAVANESKGNSYFNGYLGGLVSGGIQSTLSRFPGGTVWGGALGTGLGTATTMGLNNIDPYSANSTASEIVSESGKSALKATVTSTLTAAIGTGVGGIDYKTGQLYGGVADGCGGLMPSLTLGFGEGIKAFFGAVDDAVVYLWE